MPDPESTFYAAVAGRRQDVINQWQNHAANLENQIRQLKERNARLQEQVEESNRRGVTWQEKACDIAGSSMTANKAFREVNGQTVREYLGDAETDRRVARNRKEYVNEVVGK